MDEQRLFAWFQHQEPAALITETAQLRVFELAVEGREANTELQKTL